MYFLGSSCYCECCLHKEFFLKTLSVLSDRSVLRTRFSRSDSGLCQEPGCSDGSIQDQVLSSGHRKVNVPQIWLHVLPSAGIFSGLHLLKIQVFRGKTFENKVKINYYTYMYIKKLIIIIFLYFYFINLSNSLKPNKWNLLCSSWVLYEKEQFSGSLYVLQEGDYPNLVSMGCSDSCMIRSLKAIPTVGQLWVWMSNENVPFFSRWSFVSVLR